jgi:acyl carrier protein
LSTADSESIRTKVVAALLAEGKLAAPATELADSTAINAGEFRIDSLAFIRAFIAMEDEFDIEFGDDALMQNNFADVGAIVAYVESEIRKQASA